MKRFVQLHLLTSYPPANLNRDDLGRPKTAMMGGRLRLRVSSQSLKRAWRTSEVFSQALDGHVGTRTKRMGEEIFKQLCDKGVDEKKAKEWAEKIASVFGKAKKAKKSGEKKEKKNDELQELQIEQLAHFSPEEKQAIDALVNAIASGKEPSDAKELQTLLHESHTAADIALFGRMLASDPKYNTEAAAQVAHAITVHSVQVEDDYFTAVDDLNTGEEDAGAGHLGQTEFGAGVFYIYLCIDRKSLLANLSDDRALADKTLATLIKCATTIAPTGKQNSFASRARASYVRCETGDQQPRSLSVAFLKPVQDGNMLDTAIKNLESEAARQDKAYGMCVDASCVMNVAAGNGTLADIIKFATEADHA
ncbi:MAG: type I-E CRISPR-associated protein Cas7/Cse4/CasC [Pseudomonadota bacterium]|nr:type I-E CRISPR-associated protein Cas7/Cse4/CasC [Pseudomonadota bacterium]